jgi:glycosidase
MSSKKLNWPVHPKIFEINTWPWLTNLSEIFGHNIKLDSIPIELIDQELTRFDAIWLMGVWEHSPIGRDIAINDEGLQKDYLKALRHYSSQDVVGSPYSVYYYHVSSQLGGPNALKSFRADLMDRDLLLILDYVPNHVSIDHLWTLEKSDVFIKGTLEELMTRPYDFYSLGDTVYAHGRDPNFPPWIDTLQINAFSPDARTKAINTLLSIAEQCDGVRCDMAMLMVNSVFSKTWGERAGMPLENEFWVDIISAVKKKHPDFKFIAEVYWGMEWELIQQGFDYCYDKTLYERLINSNVQSIKEHLSADINYQKKLLRFIENHDESRAVAAFGTDASMAASIITTTLPGARLVYEGQTHGYEIKLPIQLGRGPTEEDNIIITEFYEKLLKIVPGKDWDDGKWFLCDTKSSDSSNTSFRNIISYQWLKGEQRLLIVINYNPDLSKAHIIINNIAYGSSDWCFTDLLNEKGYKYKGNDLNENGLYVELEGWKSHIFRVEKV